MWSGRGVVRVGRFEELEGGRNRFGTFAVRDGDTKTRGVLYLGGTIMGRSYGTLFTMCLNFHRKYIY
jgi:hypothetical protein